MKETHTKTQGKPPRKEENHEPKENRFPTTLPCRLVGLAQRSDACLFAHNMMQ